MRVAYQVVHLDAKRIAAAVRAHWLIENVLHQTLDVVFNEDNSRVRKDHAGENMAIVRHIVMYKGKTS